MVDMIGNMVNLGDKVLYCSRGSKRLTIGYLVREIGPRKGIVAGSPDALHFWIKMQEERNKELLEKYPDGKYQTDPVTSFTGDKVVTPDQIYKIV